jgi:chromosome segregation ATPase
MENLNTQVNSNNQLKAQYTSLLRVNNQIEKLNEEMKETQNSLLIQKDLIENEMANLRSLYETEKTTSLSLFGRVNELEASLQAATAENSKLKDKEGFNLNEVSKFQQLLGQLEREKANLEDQLKNLEQNINQNEVLIDSAG